MQFYINGQPVSEEVYANVQSRPIMESYFDKNSEKVRWKPIDTNVKNMTKMVRATVTTNQGE